jgi:hypothetical protein
LWILIIIGILAVLIVFFGIYVMRKGKQKLEPIQSGMAIGGIIGMLVGIALVEFWGYEYPLPFVLWLLGMAGGQVAGWFYKRK